MAPESEPLSERRGGPIGEQNSRPAGGEYHLPRRAVACRDGHSYIPSGMRALVMSTVVFVAVLAAGGCGNEKPRPTVGEDEVTAAHLRALPLESPYLRYLEPDEEEARAIAEEEQREAARPQSRNEDGLYPEEQGLHEEDDGSQDKFGQASIAILQVAIVVGATVAPYFFF